MSGRGDHRQVARESMRRLTERRARWARNAVRCSACGFARSNVIHETDREHAIGGLAYYADVPFCEFVSSQPDVVTTARDGDAPVSGRGEALTPESEALLRDLMEPVKGSPDHLGATYRGYRDRLAAIEAAAAREALPSVEEMAAALCQEVPHSTALHPVIDEDRARRVLDHIRAARASDGGR